jgi:hypothetical protein
MVFPKTGAAPSNSAQSLQINEPIRGKWRSASSQQCSASVTLCAGRLRIGLQSGSRRTLSRKPERAKTRRNFNEERRCFDATNLDRFVFVLSLFRVFAIRLPCVGTQFARSANFAKVPPTGQPIPTSTSHRASLARVRFPNREEASRSHAPALVAVANDKIPGGNNSPW